MSDKRLKSRSRSFILLAVPVSIAIAVSCPALASGQAIGSVVASTNATVSGQQLLPNTTIFSGDTLEVRNGAAEVVVSDGSRLVFGRDTETSFLREGDTVTVLLQRGNIVLYHPQARAGLQVKVSDLLIRPAIDLKAIGEITILGDEVVVTSKEGVLWVEGNGPPVDVSTGKRAIIKLNAAHVPQATSASGAPARKGSPKVSTVATLGLSALGTVVSFAGLSRASDAAAAANGAKATATAAINTAAAAANAAAAAANAAQAAINLANATALASLAEVNRLGCELDALAGSIGKPSPYVPPPGFTCQ